jgi:hypothetical protein
MTKDPRRARLLQGATNFRDLGGYRGHSGRPLRWRRLFRSDHFAGLTPEDRAALAPLGLTRSFDFRGVEERAAVPYEIAGVVQHSLAIEPTVTQRMQAMAEAGQSITPERVSALMEDLALGSLAAAGVAGAAGWFSLDKETRGLLATLPTNRDLLFWSQCAARRGVSARWTGCRCWPSARRPRPAARRGRCRRGRR